jgi:hypothetical protein
LVSKLPNIAELGAQLGYTERHYRNVLSRFISWFNPELTIVTENLTANETARFLLRLHTPDTEEEKLDKQMGRLTRKAGTSLRPVMAYLYEIVNAKYKGCLPLEKETEIRKEMMRVWRTASLRSAPQATHVRTGLCCCR